MTFQAALPKGCYTVTADRGKLKRVLDNLVSNAVKYGKPGGEIHFSAEEYEGGLVLQVTDNGKGISPQALHHVFDSFSGRTPPAPAPSPAAGWGWRSAGASWTATTEKFGSPAKRGGHPCLCLSPLQKEEGMA